MSSVSSVGTTNVDLYNILQNSTAPSSSSTTAIADDSNTTTTQTTPTEKHGGHHHHHSGVSGQIESAVSSALQSAPDGSDPNQVVKDAISKVLQGNGQDGTGASSSSTPSATNAPSGSANSFAQLLQSYGIDSQQFEQDLQSALPGGQDGSVDYSKLFKSFPPGSAIETTG